MTITRVVRDKTICDKSPCQDVLAHALATLEKRIDDVALRTMAYRRGSLVTGLVAQYLRMAAAR